MIKKYSIMKKLFFAAMLAAVLTASGCTATETAVGDSDSETEAADAEEPYDGYTLISEPEYFDESKGFYLIKDEWEKPDDPYAATEDDGTLCLYVSFADGTPYDFAGVIYDHELFSMEIYGNRAASDGAAVGDGETLRLYRMIPQSPGETGVLVLYKYLTDDTYEGNAYRVVIDDDLRCSIEAAEEVYEGDFELNDFPSY